MALDLFSPVIRDKNIPPHYTCDGDNVSPPLQWENVPEGTQGFALIVEDPDAPGGDFTHWILYNLPPSLRWLPEDVRRDQILPNGAMQGRNSFQRIGYGGPCPPGGTHNYAFRLYALDVLLELPAAATKEDLLEAMQGHVLAEAQMIGRYTRH
jgi:Raf kinase inhibitor-like YbhB/YbcL family protein